MKYSKFRVTQSRLRFWRAIVTVDGRAMASRIQELGRFWRTVRHLRPVQVYGRLWFRLARPRPDLAPAPHIRLGAATWHPPACRAPSMTAPGAFRFLNEGGTLAAHGWDDPALPKLWRYNQHYFDDLNAEGALARAPWHQALIVDWIAANPPGHGSGWEPYPTSLRIVNWVKWALAGHTLDDDMRHSLAVQTRWLSRRLEWHLLGNHLFANAKALVFAGLYFDGPEALGWLAKGAQILAREVPEQILPDGGQFELSPMYHALAVEDMLDLVNIARAFGREDLAESWRARLPAMLDWLAVMTHPDGELAFFNDTAIGIAPTGDRIIAYAKSLGFAPPTLPDGPQHLVASGYARLSAGQAVVIVDLAPIGPDYLPGHAHADTLSFEVSLQCKRVIVNSGTSVYGLGPERLRQRGTAAHSTLMLDGQDSSEVWSGFRVGRRARPRGVRVATDGPVQLAEGAHDGYRHLSGAPLHRREWQLCATGMVLTDRVEGRGAHHIEVRFHLAPGHCAEILPDGAVHVTQERGQGVMTLTTDGATLAVEPSSWHPQFGQSLPSQVICLRADASLPAVIKTCFDWIDG
jgi:uncharacterized heparinase superfamily protein